MNKTRKQIREKKCEKGDSIVRSDFRVTMGVND
jgi:hypothetical protein